MNRTQDAVHDSEGFTIRSGWMRVQIHAFWLIQVLWLHEQETPFKASQAKEEFIGRTRVSQNTRANSPVGAHGSWGLENCQKAKAPLPLQAAHALCTVFPSSPEPAALRAHFPWLTVALAATLHRGLSSGITTSGQWSLFRYHSDFQERSFTGLRFTVCDQGLVIGRQWAHGPLTQHLPLVQSAMAGDGWQEENVDSTHKGLTESELDACPY